MSSDSRYVLKVFLYEIEPQIWRRFSISGEATMAQLHTALQEAMGWEDKGEHEFRHGKGKNLRDVVASKEVLAGLPAGVAGTDEATISLAGFVGRGKLPKRFLYRYDFADDWIHEIVIEEKVDGGSGKPEILGGERACPPEDCGGTWGYNDILSGEIEALDDDWDAEAFDVADVRFS